MNISNIILQLQQKAKTATSAYDLMVFAKAIEKLKVCEISVVPSIGQLPTVASASVGEIYLVEDSNDLYTNTGTAWASLNNEVLGTLLAAWGANNSGQLGDNSTTSKVSPVYSSIITNWKKVFAGPESAHGFGLDSNYTLYAWGSNSYGQLGDGSYSTRSSPVTVVGGITGWSQISAGPSHTLGITSTGVAYAWGRNNYGKLGDNSAVGKQSPVSVVGGLTWRQVSAGSGSSAGIASTGVIYTWGQNSSGQLGDNTTVSKSSPVSVSGGITAWKQVSVGTRHVAAVTTTGSIYTWGNNGYGQLGQSVAITTSRSSPTAISGGIANWSQVSAGANHCVGVTSSGIAYAWGRNNYGQLGDGTNVNKSSPVSVVGGITNWSQVACGANHNICTTTNAEYAWGNNANGILSDSTTTNRSSPVSILKPSTYQWVQIVPASTHNLAIAAVTKTA